ncbi:MAG: SPFH domain-containing protein [Myxococcota bacterium]
MGLWDRITSQFIEIIEHLDDHHDTLVWRFPVRAQEIKNGAKLVVREGQAAVFVNEGRMADVFGPGTHTLDTQNLPILATLKGWKYGFNSPFKAEVYFVKTTLVTGLKWGTRNPIMLRDPEFGPMRLRAFGMFNLRVIDPAALLKELSGTDGLFQVDEIESYLKRNMVSRFSQALGSSQIPALDLASNYEVVSQRVAPMLAQDFVDVGIEITQFVVENISLPPEVEKVLDQRTGMGIVGNVQQYAAYQMANSIPDAAKTPNSMAGAGLGMAAGFQMANQLAGSWGGSPVHAPPAAAPPPVGPAPASSPAGDMVARLQKLDALRSAGVLSDQEYASKRQEILAEI